MATLPGENQTPARHSAPIEPDGEERAIASSPIPHAEDVSMNSDFKASAWLGGAFAAALACGVALPGAGASAQPGEFENGILQPLASGFPNRPITITIADSPGSREGIWATNLQEAVRQVSPVDVVISNEDAPTWGTWYLVIDVAERDGGLEGYYPIGVTIPGMTLDLLVEPITADTGLTAEDMNFVAILERIPYMGIQRKDAPWGKTFDDMVKYAKENPGKITYISNQVGSGNDIAMEWILNEVGIEVTKIPAANTEAQGATMGGGEGDFALIQVPAGLQLYQAGRVDVTLLTGDTVPAPWNDDPNVVSTTGYGLPPTPFGIVQGLMVPPGVPQENIDWLHKLFAAAAETETYKNREKTVPGLTVKVLTAEEANEIRDNVLAFGDPVVRELGMHLEQK